MMKNDTLLKRLNVFGFPLLQIEEDQDANLTLADMVKSKETRLWEGFPVVLANSAEKKLFDYDKVNLKFKNVFDKSCLVSLMLMSFALYKVLNLKFSWANKFYKSLSKDRKKEFNVLVKKIKNSDNFQVASRVMSSQRLKTTFNNYYFGKVHTELSGLLSAKEEFGLEYALSQVFSPKQKELFFKKLKREKLTKTEKEYFSRIVKKKVLALANSELHRLALSLLE